MKLRFTARADKDYTDLPVRIRKAFAKNFVSCLPIFNIRRYTSKSEEMDLWQGRVTKGWRFYFKIEGNEYIIITVIPHPK